MVHVYSNIIASERVASCFRPFGRAVRPKIFLQRAHRALKAFIKALATESGDHWLATTSYRFASYQVRMDRYWLGGPVAPLFVGTGATFRGKRATEKQIQPLVCVTLWE